MVEEIEKVVRKVKEDLPRGIVKREFDKEAWKPKTEIGRKVKSGEIKSMEEIFNSGKKILESKIVDALISNLESEFIDVGQSKGKFGGGKRSIWRQTQKKTKEGNKPKFTTLIVVGNRDGYVGLGRGKAKETMPAREKALHQAKLNLIQIVRGCGSWAGVPDTNSIPFAVEGKCGSVKLRLMPAPKGTGLCVENQCKKMLALAGIKDIYSKTFGQTKIKINLMEACFDALKNLSLVKVKQEHLEKLGYKEGPLQSQQFEDGKKENSSN
ncbi:30S ribosomal protein S5 [Candidatus Woesearchaeota archaeon]|nr:30S ribosomal protein S5 [Candidatus Woesearchaeota archaeon]